MVFRLFLAFTVGVLLPAFALRAEPARAAHVFIVSIDGGKPAVIAESEMPILKSLAAGGAHTWEARTIMPSITLPSHTSMLTGVKADKHGILWNEWEPDKGLVKVPTVFALAKERGLATAMFAGKPKFRHLALPGSLDVFALPGASAGNGKATDGEVAATFARALEDGLRPAIAFIHFPQTDTMGHQYGWGSPEQKAALAASDAALKVVLDAIRAAGMENDSVVIVTADHGGHGKGHGEDIPDDMIIPWVAHGPAVRPGHAIAAPVGTCDTAATTLWLLGLPVPESFDGKPVTEAFKPVPAAKP